MARVFIGMGSNLADPKGQLLAATKALNEIPKTQLVKRSSLYASDPLGPADQPRYVNAVAELQTQLEPLVLLDALQQIEQTQGRVRKDQRWGPRTLDLDILLIDQLIINESRLTVPHYHMHARAFVLYPLSELAPELVMPDSRPLSEWLKACAFEGLEKLAES